MSIGSTRRAGVVLLALFAVSGFAGLIYESIWTQYLGLFLGHAAYAQSFVLMLFMGGMALGAWLVSRTIARIVRPLAVYAAVELAIGILGIAFDPLYHAATGFAYAMLFPRVGEVIGLDLVRYALSMILIGPQCIALGATFPLMSAGYLRAEPRARGSVLAGLYFSNSMGAAVGALVATFVLLPAVGLPGTVMTGGLLSILVAMAVWPLAKRPSTGAYGEPAMSTGGATPRLIVVAAAITGATSFVYEITWIRMLALALGSTLHAFELMLAAFIGGIAFGGWWLRRRVDGFGDVVAATGWAQLCMGVAALGSLFVYAHSFDWVAALLQGIARTPTGYALYNVATGAIAIAVMFPAAFFAGMTLPLLTLALLRRSAGEKAVGQVYAANTLGAIAGVLLTVHVLMPLAGVRIALWLAALADLALGVLLLSRARIAPRSRFAAAAVAIACGISALAFTRVDPATLASSVYRSGSARLQEGTEMLFYGDGKTASVALFQTPGKEGMRSIATNGKVDASIATADDVAPSGDEYTMTLAALLPLMSVPEPKHAAVIGFGSGMTVHALLGSRRLERVDVVEIEPFMVEAARGFGARAARAHEDPRVHVVIDDAKAFLAGAARRYDVIVSEPSNPWVNGVAALFSDEFYEFVPQHLTENGVYVQWLQLYEITPALVGSVLKAMLPHFADVNAYLSNEGDMILVAAPRGRLPALGDPGFDPALAGELARLAMNRREYLAQFGLMGKSGLAALAAMSDVPPNSDLFPVLQIYAPEARFMKASALAISDLQRAPAPLLEVLGEYSPPAVATEPSPAPTRLRRDVPSRAARAYREALLSGAAASSPFANKDVAGSLAILRSAAPACAGLDPDRWIEASVAVAEATIPYLSAQDLDGVWIEPRWTPDCIREIHATAAALDFHAAFAARDWSRVARDGSLLLAGGKLRGEWQSYVVLGTGLAYVALGDWSRFNELDAASASSVNHEFELAFLKSVATAAGRSAAAGNAVTARD